MRWILLNRNNVICKPNLTCFTNYIDSRQDKKIIDFSMVEKDATSCPEWDITVVYASLFRGITADKPILQSIGMFHTGIAFTCRINPSIKIIIDFAAIEAIKILESAIGVMNLKYKQGEMCVKDPNNFGYVGYATGSEANLKYDNYWIDGRLPIGIIPSDKLVELLRWVYDVYAPTHPRYYLLQVAEEKDSQIGLIPSNVILKCTTCSQFVIDTLAYLNSGLKVQTNWDKLNFNNVVLYVNKYTLLPINEPIPFDAKQFILNMIAEILGIKPCMGCEETLFKQIMEKMQELFKYAYKGQVAEIIQKMMAYFSITKKAFFFVESKEGEIMAAYATLQYPYVRSGLYPDKNFLQCKTIPVEDRFFSSLFQMGDASTTKKVLFPVAIIILIFIIAFVMYKYFKK